MGFMDDVPAKCLAAPARGAAPGPRGPRIVDGNFARPAATVRRAARDEFDQRAPDDDGERVYRVDDDVGDTAGEPFRSGDAVRHAQLGGGRVVAVSGSGKDRKVIVEFASSGRKTVMARYLTATDVN
jgi:hypothetical protein